MQERILEKIEHSFVYRLFNPQVPSIVCSKSEDRVAAMPANSCMSISDSPSMIALAIRIGSNTGKVVRKSECFSLNWVSFDLERAKKSIVNLSKLSRVKDEDKLKVYGVEYKLVRGIPVLLDSHAYLLCRVKRALINGDHELFLSVVTEARASRDFTRDNYWRFKSYRPILYLGSIRKEPLTTIRESF